MSDNNMNEKTKQIIEATFNEVSSKYDANLFFQITAQHLAQSFSSKENDKLLDVSTGTGTVVFEILKQHPSLDILAVDISKGMLDIAKEKANKLNIKNITFKQDDVEKLSYPNNHFHIITCGFGLFFYPNMKDTFNSLCKMIKKEGKFIFSSFTKNAFEPYTSAFFDTLEKDYKIKFPIKASGLLSTQEDIELLVLNKHPLNYEIEEVKISYVITIEQWWELLNSAGYKTLLNKLNEKDLQDFKTKHLKQIESLSTKGNIKLTVNTLITTVHL
ncbi:MAG: class I SAM-dependent methyltransferase [Campylobacteraceae bacterium]|nr:class I SAM-dependent methyltransferase [Campylobacteraceae bacterium]